MIRYEVIHKSWKEMIDCDKIEIKDGWASFYKCGYSKNPDIPISWETLIIAFPTNDVVRISVFSDIQ